MPTHRDIIQSLGGPSALARALKLSVVNTTGKWPRRGIPPLYWHRISQIAADKGVAVSAEDLERGSPLQAAQAEAV